MKKHHIGEELGGRTASAIHEKHGGRVGMPPPPYLIRNTGHLVSIKTENDENRVRDWNIWLRWSLLRPRLPNLVEGDRLTPLV